LLSESQKEKYKQRAKELGLKIPGNSARFNSVGENLQEVEAKKQMQLESVEKRKNEIQEMIRNASDIGGSKMK
jgi:hypothetical protein